VLRFIGKALKRGTSLPGKIALKIDPNILKKIEMPRRILIVTGSNGKTSTVEMIAHILEKNSKKFAFNKGGSNQIQGVTTFILDDCNLFGRAKSDIFLFEADEHFAKRMLNFFKPTHLLITNLYRDQQVRNGNPEWVYKGIEQSVNNTDITMVLNANDPLVSCFGFNKENTVWFGFDNMIGTTREITSVYNDGKFCPKCKNFLEYEYYHYNHIGKFCCENCGFKTAKTQYTGNYTEEEKEGFLINNEYKIKISFENISIGFYYNLLAAFAGSNLLGIKAEDICKSLESFVSKIFRVVKFDLDKYNGVLLISKHENSVSYDQSIRVIVEYNEPCTAVIIVDNISRKYSTNNISWFYDIDFEMFKSEKVKKIILSGFYCNDLAVCLSLTEIPIEKISVFEKIPDCIKYLRDNTEGKIFVITCFSDKDKFLEEVAVCDVNEIDS
jgi:UDP-N-acetylmuramyl pentapeptide synthase